MSPGRDSRSVHPGEISALLAQMRDGDPSAREAMLPIVYGDLEAIARGYVRGGDPSLEPQGLVHELYLRLAPAPIEARDRKHFFAVAALAMRQILTDRARKRGSQKRGGDAVRVTLSELGDGRQLVDLIAIEDALRRLEELSPRQARIVELRCLVGLTVEETAEVLGLSERTVHAEWRMARAWLSRALAE